MSNKIDEKQRAEEAKMAKSIHDFLKSDEIIKSFVFDEGDYDEQTVALLKKQVFDDNGKIVNGVYTVLVEHYLDNLDTNLNMRFGGIYNVKDDLFYIKGSNSGAEYSAFDVFTQEDFDKWVRWTDYIEEDFAFTLKEKAIKRAVKFLRTKDWKKAIINDTGIENFLMKRMVKEIFKGEMAAKHSCLDIYFGGGYAPSDRALAVSVVNQDYIAEYVDRLLDDNNNFTMEEVKEKAYQHLKDTFTFTFTAERSLAMFWAIKFAFTNEKFTKDSTLDMVYVNSRGTKRALTNVNPEEFTEYFETKRLSDFTRHNVGALPSDKRDKFREQEININNIQELILDGQKIWTRYKADME